MNILELDSFKLSDAVKFHNRLNPKIWGRDEHLLPEVRTKLLEIAADFQEFLGVLDLDVKDITLSGSNAAYSYTPHSDIDLHLVVDVPRDEIYQELFNAKKYQYNDIHNIRIHGADVELYVQPADEAPVSLGEYSIVNNAWIEIPKRKRAKIDQTLVRHKYEDIKARIESALKEKDSDRVQALISKIKEMRQSGLDAHGEFGPENLAFKMLRKQGWIKKLYDHVAAVKDRELSLKEQEPKKPFRYGFGSDTSSASDYRALFKPAEPKTPNGPSELHFKSPQEYEWYRNQEARKKELAAEDAGETWDGVNPTTCMVVNEEDKDQEQIVHEFIEWAANRLGIDKMPEIFVHTDPDWSVKEHSFGRYEPDSHSLHVNMANRHLFDILRTTAHELAHCKQNQNQKLPPEAGETGSHWENEAHAAAGIIMRDFADAHPELFNTAPLSEGKVGRALAASAIALAASLSYAQEYQQQPSPTLSALNAALKVYGLSKITAPGVKEQLNQEVKNYIRAQGGDANAQNQSWSWQMQNQRNTQDQPVRENASGYIPTKKQAKDPRFSMALTVDIKPGEVGRQANKMKLGTDSQGHPAMVYRSANQLHETLAAEFAAFFESRSYGYGSTPLSQVPGEIEDELGNQEATGPETPPQMPAGTTKIDVSDLTDWYRLGQDISDMDDADPEDYGKGPPQTVIVFPSDEAEQGYLKQFKRLGLKTHDMDPDVRGGEDIYGKHLKELAEAFDQPYPLKWTKSEYGDYDALARLSDGSPLSISFEHTTPYEVEVSFTRNHSLDVTGAGDAQRVFATVLAAIQEFLKKEQPANISFSASKEDEEGGNTESRAKLYNRLVDRYATQWGYSVRVFDQGSQVEYELYRGFESPFESQEHDLVESLRQEFEQLEEEFLGEIKMSPTNLRAEAAKTGARAGMEFEMIVPNAGAVDSEPEYEPDYDQDTRTRSFSDIRDFFYDGDYNGRRDVENLEEALQEQFEEWLEEQIFENWQDEGIDYLRDYIENNDYFDKEDAQEEATNALQAEYGDDISPEDFEKMLAAIVQEKFDEFVQDQWDNQGRYYDDALDQFRDEQSQDIDESDWLHEHYPYMTDIQNNFDIAWPYYYDPNEGEEADIDAIADDFSNAVGKPVNASRSYHGARREAGHYVVEPDGSLEGDNPGDAGLEFVSPPMPIDEMMSDLNKVKAWADREGCYTNDSTGLHINISVPDFSIEKLDYVKLALLLGDKYILDQYGRASNTYTKSALDKVQQKVKADPAQAKAMLDKMRNGMEQLASKAIHSGTTDKYTSINTKSGYIEFRSPGGDWLNENFDKIENTLLRFTVALSAAMDPAAYREEYLKKLYKLLEPVAVEQSKDTIKYFADYVAGKTPKAALRSFVKQAQLERRLKKGTLDGQQYWWRVDRDGRGASNSPSIEVVATSKEEALAKARKEWNIPDGSTAMNKADAYPLRPYDQTPAKVSTGAPEPVGQQGNWGIWMRDANRFSRAPGQIDNSVLRRFPSREAAEQWIEQTRAERPGMRTDIEVREIEPGQQSGPTAGGRASNPDGNYVIFANNSRAGDPPAYRFMAADNDDADTVLLQWSREHPGYWEVHYDPNQRLGQPPIPGSTLDLQRQRAAAAQRQTPDQRQGGLIDVAGETPAPQPLGAGRELVGWEIRIDGQPVHTLSGIGNNQGDANRLAQQWVLQQGSNFLRQHQGGEVEVVPAWREA